MKELIVVLDIILAIAFVYQLAMYLRERKNKNEE